jgi:hypothetical protein
MSAINGDKSRFNRERKKRAAQRKRTRAMLTRAVAHKSPDVSSASDAKSVKS